MILNIVISLVVLAAAASRVYLRKYVGVLLVLFLAGCSVPKKSLQVISNSDTSTAVKQTTVVEDSIIVIPAATLRAVIINPCDSIGRLKPSLQQSKSGGSNLSIRMVHDSILVDCNCDEQISRFKKEISNRDSVIRLSSETKTTQVNTAIEYRTPWYNKVAIFLLILSNIVYVIKYLLK